MSKSVTISLFLLDGTAGGRIRCTISGRTGVILKIPRKDLSKCNELDALKSDGVYFLLGEADGRQKIYVGQAGSRKNGKGLLNRLNEHNRDVTKNFWTEAIILTTIDNSFGATEISWLEHKFCNMSSDIEAYAEFTQLVLSAIGYKIFEPPQKNSVPPVAEADDEIFYLSRKIKRIGRTIAATMIRTPTGYKILAGSEICPIDSDKLSAPLKKLRHSEKISDGRLTEDVEFSASSTAAEFVIGNSANGLQEWRTRDGLPLKNFLGGN